MEDSLFPNIGEYVEGACCHYLFYVDVCRDKTVNMHTIVRNVMWVCGFQFVQAGLSVGHLNPLYSFCGGYFVCFLLRVPFVWERSSTRDHVLGMLVILA